jgi:hypothetical protein
LLKLAPNRAAVRTVTMPCVTANRPRRTSPIKIVSATLLR